MFNRRSYRQFCRYVTSSWVSPTRSIAHLNGISVEHTNQSNLNRFIRNIDTLDIFRKSVDLINRFSTDPVLIIDDTVFQRSGKHIQGAGWVYDHAEGRSVWGMPAITAAISCNEGIFPANIDLKAVSNGMGKPSKITMQMGVIRRAITAGLKFSMVLMDSWYFASRMIGFLEHEGKSWISEAKSNRLIYVNEKWISLQEYSDSLNPEEMKCFTIGNEQYLTVSMATKMKRIGDVRVVISKGKDSVKFFVTDMIAWKPKRIMEMYLRRWDIEVMHRELKQDGLGKAFQRVFAGLAQSAKLSLLGELLLEISALRSLGTQLKIGKGTPGLRHRSMAVRFLDDLFVALESGGGKLMDAVMESIRRPYTSTIGIMGG